MFQGIRYTLSERCKTKSSLFIGLLETIIKITEYNEQSFKTNAEKKNNFPHYKRMEQSGKTSHPHQEARIHRSHLWKGM